MSTSIENFIEKLVNEAVTYHQLERGKRSNQFSDSNSEIYSNQEYIIEQIIINLAKYSISIEQYEIGKNSFNIKTFGNPI